GPGVDATLRRSGRRGESAEAALPTEAGRKLSSRGATPRAREFRHSGVHIRYHRSRYHPDTRSNPGSGTPLAVLPGLKQRNVRQGTIRPANREDAVLAAQPVWRSKGFFLLGDGKLSRELRPAREQRHLVQS